jgi:hypothetical protein
VIRVGVERQPQLIDAAAGLNDATACVSRAVTRSSSQGVDAVAPLLRRRQRSGGRAADSGSSGLSSSLPMPMTPLVLVHLDTHFEVAPGLSPAEATRSFDAVQRAAHWSCSLLSGAGSGTCVA